MRNTLPCPGSLATVMVPPVWFTMPYTVESPRPVPLPGSLVVKNGSNSRKRVSASMPIPVSHTESMT